MYDIIILFILFSKHWFLGQQGWIFWENHLYNRGQKSMSLKGILYLYNITIWLCIIWFTPVHKYYVHKDFTLPLFYIFHLDSLIDTKGRILFSKTKWNVKFTSIVASLFGGDPTSSRWLFSMHTILGVFAIQWKNVYPSVRMKIKISIGFWFSDNMISLFKGSF